jgi:hypothetical protein
MLFDFAFKGGTGSGVGSYYTESLKDHYNVCVAMLVVAFSLTSIFLVMFFCSNRIEASDSVQFLHLAF